MMDDLMGQSSAMSEKVNAQLAAIELSHSIDGVTVKGNATGAIMDVSISDELLSPENKEQLEDLLVTCLQEIKTQAANESEKISQKMLGDMLSGGFGNLFG